MKAVFALLRHFLFWQPIMRWTFGFGFLLASAGVIWYQFETESKAHTLLTLLGVGFMWLFPLMVSVIGFRQLVSNTRLSLTPMLRFKAGLALLLLTVLSSISLGMASAAIKQGLNFVVFTSSFALISFFLLLGQWWLGSRWGAALYWLFIVGSSQIWQLPKLRAAVSEPNFSLLLAGVAIVCWCWLLYWLTTTRRISRLNGIFAQMNELHSNQQVQAPMAVLKWSFAGTRSATNTLMLGAYYNIKNRFSIQLFLYLAFPAMMVIVLAVPMLAKGKPLDKMLNPIALLAMGLYGSFMAGFLGREWLARVRCLWLRSPGNRQALWHLLEQLLWKDAGLSVVVAILYAVVVGWLTGMPLSYGVWFVFLGASSLLLHLYLAQYIRVRLLGMAWNLVLLVFAILLLAGSTAVAYFQQSTWPLLLVVTLQCVAAWQFRVRTKQRFLTVDWCQIRPLQFSRNCATISG
ncbi:MAG: hypothetical protein ACOY3E_12655 [Pseudomonadota bacterium]